MQLSDLMRSQVLDADGTSLGRVVDVRVVQDGPMLLPFGAAFRVDGLLVGRRRGVATRLGYHRTGMKGPWLLRALFSALEKRARYVPWEAVVEWDGRTVRVSVHEALQPDAGNSRT